MDVLTLDDSILAVLRQIKQPAELRDQRGNLIGTFTPAQESCVVTSPRGTEVDIAELERRRATEKGGKSLREIFEQLKKLTTDPALRADLDRKIENLAQRERCDTP